MNTPPQTRATRHMQARMSQRGIPGDLVDLVCRYGRDEDDKLILNRNDLQHLLNGLRGLERTVMKALDKGGVIVVADGGALITTYNHESYDRRRVHGR